MRTSFQSLLSKLNTGQLAALTAVLFLLDIVVPDPLPFVDELLLGLLTLLLARRTASTTPPPEPPMEPPHDEPGNPRSTY